jgi:hypothetical protein
VIFRNRIYFLRYQCYLIIIMVRHIFQACPVWIYTQSNITSIIFTWVHYTNTEKSLNLCYIRKIFFGVSGKFFSYLGKMSYIRKMF